MEILKGILFLIVGLVLLRWAYKIGTNEEPLNTDKDSLLRVVFTILIGITGIEYLVKLFNLLGF